MCGRYTRRRYVQELSDEFEAEFAAEMALDPSYNVAPAQNCLVIGPGARKLDIFKWGLVPSWSTAETGAATRINACAETLTERASYKPILARGRCLIPADGFYEWEKPFKQPYLFTMRGGEPFVFAGLCDTWEKPDGTTLKTFTIITTSPNEVVAPIHDRMPAIIDRADIDAWLDPNSLMATALSLLKPYRAEAMQSAPVRPLVNSVKNNGPNLVDPIVLPQRFAQSEFGW
jgi:putative SOS response-associated peptidase YedK